MSSTNELALLINYMKEEFELYEIVEDIASFVSDDYVSPYCLVHIHEEEKYKDSHGFDCEQTILTLVFKSELPLSKYPHIEIILCKHFREVGNYAGTCDEDESELIQYDLIFKENVSIQQKETISCKTPIQLIISKEHIKHMLLYDHSYFDLCYDKNVEVFEIGKGKSDFVKVTDESYFKQFDEEDFKEDFK